MSVVLNNPPAVTVKTAARTIQIDFADWLSCLCRHTVKPVNRHMRIANKLYNSFLRNREKTERKTLFL